MKTIYQQNLAKLALLLLPVLTACGQISPLGQQKGLTIDLAYLRTPTTTASDTNGSCRYNEVVQPDNDTWLDGSGTFSVCTSSSDSSSVTLFGSAAQGADQYCIFPAAVNESGAIFPRVEAGSGLPLMKCSGKVSGSQLFTFEGTTYNALFAVPYQDRYQMRNCLASGNYFSCPKSFSYGQFRDN